MFKKQDFAQTLAQEALLPLVGQYKFPESGSLDEVNAMLDTVLFSFNRFEALPAYVITRALYPAQDGVTLDSARFVLRPSSSHKIEIDELKKVVTINAGEDFFDRFVKELAAYFDHYAYYVKLQENINEFNDMIASVIAERNLDLTIKFTIGKGLIGATDKTALIGLSTDFVEDLSNLPAFYGTMESRKEGYKGVIGDTLAELNRAYELIKTKSPFTKDLGIYSRKNTSKLIRGFVNRKAEFVRTGVGYLETDKLFAVIEKTAVTEAELAELDLENVVVTDNESITKREQEAGKTKVVTRYLISPFEKEDGNPSDIKLSELVTAE